MQRSIPIQKGFASGGNLLLEARIIITLGANGLGFPWEILGSLCVSPSRQGST